MDREAELRNFVSARDAALAATAAANHGQPVMRLGAHLVWWT